MKLVYYELKKIWTSAAVLKVAFFMIFLSGVMFLGALREDRDWLPEYLAYHEVLESVEKDELQSWLAWEEKELQGGQSWIGNVSKKKAFACIKKEIEAITGYDAYREEIQNRYEESSSFSIFSESDSIQQEYLRKTAEAYRELQIHSPMQPGVYRGIEILLEFYGGDLLLIVFLIYLVSAVFLQEEKNGKSQFLCTMVRGKQLFTVKTAAVCISMILYMGVAFLLNLLLTEMIYGLPSLETAVQSIPDLYSVPYPWTIGQYLGAWFCLRLAGAFAFAASAIALNAVTRSDVITALGVFGFLGGGVWFSHFSTGDGLKAALRFWNPWSLLRGKAMIGTYELVCFPTGTVEVLWGVPLLLLLSLLLSSAAGKIKKPEKRRYIWKSREITVNPHNLFFYELKKLWIYQGGLALFCFCMILQGMTVYRYRDYFGTEEYYYQQYIDRFGNQVAGDTAEKISEEKNRLDHLQEELEKETDFARSYQIQRELERREGFDKYTDRVYRLVQEEKENIILKDAQYSLLFEDTEASRMMIILLGMSLAFLVPGVFQKEKETGMDMLQRTAVKGGGHLWRSKISVLLSYMISFLLISACFHYLKAVSSYDLILKAPLNCLGIYWENPISISAGIAYGCGVLLQCIAVAAMTVILSACAKKAKNRYAMTGVLLAVGVVPTMLSSAVSLSGLRWIHDLFFVFTNRSGFLWLIGAACVLAALGIMRKELGR